MALNRSGAAEIGKEAAAILKENYGAPGRRVERRRIGICFFLFLLLYQWLVVNNGSLWWVNPTTYTLYVLDYSMGFCTRILPGAVYMALVGKYDYRWMSAFVMVFFLALSVLASFFAEKFYEAAAPGEKKTALLMLFFFFTGPFTFGLFANAFGMLDFYWCFLFAAALPLLRKRRLKWLLPLFFAAMSFVHYAAVFSYAALLLIMILFAAAKTEDRTQKREYYALFVLCALLSAALSGYFLVFDIENVAYPLEELDRILREERGARFPEYVESALYRLTDPGAAGMANDVGRYAADPDAPGVTRFIQWFVFFVHGALAFAHSYDRLLFPVLLELPVAVFLVALLVSWFRARKGNRALRFVALLMIGFFFGGNAVAVLFAADNFRWICHAVSGLFINAFIALCFDYREGFEKARAYFRRAGLPLTAVYAAVYALTSMDPYI